MTTATRPAPPHGTEGRYRGTKNRPGCRCEPCRKANRIIRIQRERARNRGQGVLVDATPVAKHIATLNAAGTNNESIARAANVATATVRYISYGRGKTCKRPIANRILAVKPGTRDPIGNQPAIGYTRRIRALYAIGYGPDSLAAACTVSRAMLSNLANGRYQEIDGRIAAEIRRVYRTLSRQPGPSRWARARALACGWPSPAAWDDIDDPAEQPETAPVIDQRRHRADPVDPDHVARLTVQGLTTREIAERLGCNPRTIVRARRRHEQEQEVAA